MRLKSLAAAVLATLFLLAGYLSAPAQASSARPEAVPVSTVAALHTSQSSVLSVRPEAAKRYWKLKSSCKIKTHKVSFTFVYYTTTAKRTGKIHMVAATYNTVEKIKVWQGGSTSKVWWTRSIDGGSSGKNAIALKGVKRTTTKTKLRQAATSVNKSQLCSVSKLLTKSAKWNPKTGSYF